MGHRNKPLSAFWTTNWELSVGYRSFCFRIMRLWNTTGQLRWFLEETFRTKYAKKHWPALKPFTTSLKDKILKQSVPLQDACASGSVAYLNAGNQNRKKNKIDHNLKGLFDFTTASFMQWTLNRIVTSARQCVMILTSLHTCKVKRC